MKRLIVFFYLLSLLVALTSEANGQVSTSPSNTGQLATAVTPTTTTSGGAPASNKPVISIKKPDILIVKNISNPSLSKNHFRMGDIIEITCRSNGRTFDSIPGKYVLYLNGIPMKGLLPVSGPSLTNDTLINFTFHLERTRKNPEAFIAWERFFHYPRKHEHPVFFSVGTVLEEMSIRSVQSTLNLVEERTPALIILIFLLLVAGLFWLAINTPILKDTKPGQRNIYSLAQTQIAWWTVIVLGAFLHLYFYTNELTDLSEGTMILMGASAGTLLGAKLIDSNINPAQATTIASKGFVKDILSDGGGGISIHRFQFVVWTLCLSFVFIRGVIRDLAMPEFPQNLLLLMGISNGTYLLLKFSENNPNATSSSIVPAGQQAPINANTSPTNQPGGRGNSTLPIAPQATNNLTATTADQSTSNVVAKEPVKNTVTSEGDVLGREEDDMGVPAGQAGPALAGNPLSANSGMG